MQQPHPNPAFAAVLAALRQSGLAAMRYEQEGHSRFRDCLIVCRNGRLLFQRLSYGEAASLVFEMWADEVTPQGGIVWHSKNVAYSGKQEAPAAFTTYNGKALVLDGKTRRWLPVAPYKTFAKAGLGALAMLWQRLRD